MNKEIKQILKNQLTIMKELQLTGSGLGFSMNINNTLKLLNPDKEKEESSCYVQEKMGENKSDEICECGHHREYHIHDYNTKTAEEICEKCECKNFKLKNYALEEKSE